MMDDIDPSRAWIRRYLRSRPPAPSVEDEITACARETSFPSVSWDVLDGEPPLNSRGTIDQATLLEEISLPAPHSISTNHDTRFVLLSRLSSSNTEQNEVETDAALTSQRVSTPYAYTFPPSPRSKDDKEWTGTDVDPDVTTYSRVARKSSRNSVVKDEMERDDLVKAVLESKQASQDTSPHPSTNLLPLYMQPKESGCIGQNTYIAAPTSEPQFHTQSSRTSSNATSRGDTRILPSTSKAGTNVTSSEFAQLPTKTQRWAQDFTKYSNSLSTPDQPKNQEVDMSQTIHSNLQNLSSTELPTRGTGLPYPFDDLAKDVAMPLEEHYQFDHSTVASSDNSAPPKKFMDNMLDMPGKQVHRPRSPSRTGKLQFKSTSSKSLSILERPLPPCPRTQSSAKYVDWYTLSDRHLDLCPSCYENVFVNTIFASDLVLVHSYDGLKRYCDFSNPWFRLAWLITLKQDRKSLHLLGQLARITASGRPCPGDREISNDRMIWYGLADSNNGPHVSGFAICSCDKNALEILLPRVSEWFTMLPIDNQLRPADKYMCSLRVNSRRFPKYLDLLVELDVEAQSVHQAPQMDRFVRMVRANTFKGECGRDKLYVRKPWHFISLLPSFTVCEECYDEVVWPAIQDKSGHSKIPDLINKAIQLVPGEDPEFGSSCCLYSPRMRRVWAIAVNEDDFAYLKQEVLSRKHKEMSLAKERKDIVSWMARLDIGSSQWERAKSDLRIVERDWANAE